MGATLRAATGDRQPNPSHLTAAEHAAGGCAADGAVWGGDLLVRRHLSA
jgi:hypothetical protein